MNLKPYRYLNKDKNVFTSNIFFLGHSKIGKTEETGVDWRF